jgi:hypothetical protein
MTSTQIYVISSAWRKPFSIEMCPNHAAEYKRDTQYQVTLADDQEDADGQNCERCDYEADHFEDDRAELLDRMAYCQDYD